VGPLESVSFPICKSNNHSSETTLTDLDVLVNQVSLPPCFASMLLGCPPNRQQFLKRLHTHLLSRRRRRSPGPLIQISKAEQSSHAYVIPSLSSQTSELPLPPFIKDDGNMALSEER